MKPSNSSLTAGGPIAPAAVCRCALGELASYVRALPGPRRTVSLDCGLVVVVDRDPTSRKQILEIGMLAGLTGASSQIRAATAEILAGFGAETWPSELSSTPLRRFRRWREP